MSEVHVYSREQAAQLDLSSDHHRPAWNWAVISITHDPDDKLFWVKRPWHDILHLEFYDLSGPSFAYPGAQLFDEELAIAVRNFVDRNRDKGFIVHCAAGISRSVAIGVWISEHLDRNCILHATHNADRANSLVLATLRRKDWERQLTRKE